METREFLFYFLGNYGRRPFVHAELKSLARAYFKERLLHACACGYVRVRDCVCACVCAADFTPYITHTSMSSMC